MCVAQRRNGWIRERCKQIIILHQFNRRYTHKPKQDGITCFEVGSATNGYKGTNQPSHYYHPRTDGTRPCEWFVWGAKIIELLLRLNIKVWEQRNKDVHGEDNNSNRNRDDFKHWQLQSKIRKLQRFKRKARPDDEFLFVHLKTFLKSDTNILLTYFKSHKKAITNSVEQYKKMKESTGKRSIAGQLRNAAVVHRTIRRSRTRRRKREEEKERQKEIRKREQKARATFGGCNGSSPHAAIYSKAKNNSDRKSK